MLRYWMSRGMDEGQALATADRLILEKARRPEWGQETLRSIEWERQIATPGRGWWPEGWVYVLRASGPADGFYKIGRSRDLPERIKQIGIQVPFELELLHSFPADDSTTAERFLHECCADRRVKGEWFRLEERDLFWLRCIDAWRYNSPFSLLFGMLADVSRYQGPAEEGARQEK